MLEEGILPARVIVAQGPVDQKPIDELSITVQDSLVMDPSSSAAADMDVDDVGDDYDHVDMLVNADEPEEDDDLDILSP